MRLERADIVVIGAGPAGIAAACTAAESGASVLVLDDNPSPGGQIWRGAAQQHGRVANRWTSRLVSSGARISSGTRVVGATEHGTLLAERDGETLHARFSSLILATGARELLLPFPGWTLPGVAGAGGLQALVQGGLPIHGKRVVVAGSGPLLWAVAAHLHEKGAHIAAIAEQAPRRKLARFAVGLSAGKLLQAAQFNFQLGNVSVLYGAWPVSAEGDGRLRRVHLRTRHGTRSFDCDYLACGFGLVPNTEVAQLLGCEMREGFVVVDELQRTSTRDIFCAGELTGIGGLEKSLVEGTIAGYAAAGMLAEARKLLLHRKRLHRFSMWLADAFALREELKQICLPETIVCRCEDVRWGQIAAHRDWRSAKVQTRCGMGPCQGRTCGPAFAFLNGQQQPLDRVRPPLFPAPPGALASAPEIS